MKDSDGIRKKNKLVEAFFKKYTPLMLSSTAKFYGPDYRWYRDDLIQEFLEKKICKMSIKRLQELDKQGPKYVKAMLSNYLKDQKRKDKRNRAIGDILQQYYTSRKSHADPVHFEPSSTVDRCEVIIKRSFPASKNYLKVFRLMAAGAETKEIAKKTGLKEGNVRTIKFRIRNVLEEPLSNIA